MAGGHLALPPGWTSVREIAEMLGIHRVRAWEAVTRSTVPSRVFSSRWQHAGQTYHRRALALVPGGLEQLLAQRSLRQLSRLRLGTGSQIQRKKRVIDPVVR